MNYDQLDRFTLLMMIRKLVRVLFFTSAVLVSLWLLLAVGYHFIELKAPNVELSTGIDVIRSDEDVRSSGPNWYSKNSYGIWEAYLEGAAYERGFAFGQLAKDQIVSQEESFVAQIRRLIPSEWFLKTLKYGITFFNRNLQDHVSTELRHEIYGVSISFSDDYDFIGDKYSRILNYHAAHDIGHALQDLSIVGCSSFAVWDSFSSDSSLLIARNFDFYMGDDFAKDKIILFMRPDSGYAFASVTWAGFMGVVSGMNEHGLTVTLNAAKSSIPNGAKMPISLLAREILQYARTIEEAYAIAKSRETFVSESILVGSAMDHEAAIIEKSPDRIGIYRPDATRLICTNHYQSEMFRNDPINLNNIQYSDSKYRFERLHQLLGELDPIDPAKAVQILRNQEGLNEADLGMGNPKAINQLLAHHGIVFQPEKRLLWLSANPFQLGAFVCYDLNQVFGTLEATNETRGKEVIHVDSLTIPTDPFVGSAQYQQFLRYKVLKNRLFDHIALGKSIKWNEVLEQEFIGCNPESYITYFMLGDFYLEQEELEKAERYYQLSLSKEVASEQERIQIIENIDACH
ncbi:MAG: hypothetical protein RL266_337 [Bacteroidota bacterium]|jgi:hypothetical protein